TVERPMNPLPHARSPSSRPAWLTDGRAVPGAPASGSDRCRRSLAVAVQLALLARINAQHRALHITANPRRAFRGQGRCPARPRPERIRKQLQQELGKSADQIDPTVAVHLATQYAAARLGLPGLGAVAVPYGTLTKAVRADRRVGTYLFMVRVNLVVQ